jgi:heme exporter protein A
VSFIRQDPNLSSDSRAGLTVTSLEVWRGERRLFSDLSFELQPGQASYITGPNGSGKTSLLRVLAGLSVPAQGVVMWDGASVSRLAPELRAAIAYQGHLEGLKKDLTVTENLAFYRALWVGDGDIEPLLDELRLDEFADREVRYLSAGQRRRVALGCMRLRRARLWLLDEPLTNLDAAGAEVISAWLREHTAAGGTAVIATHQTDRVQGTAALEVEL